MEDNTQDKEREKRFLEAKWSPRPQPTKEEMLANRDRIRKMIAPQWAEKMNLEYGPFDPKYGVKEYTPEDMYADPMMKGNIGEDERNRAPLTTDLVAFVVWLRENTDFFGGPNLDIHFPKATDPQFYEVLAQNALLYTEE